MFSNNQKFDCKLGIKTNNTYQHYKMAKCAFLGFFPLHAIL